MHQLNTDESKFAHAFKIKFHKIVWCINLDQHSRYSHSPNGQYKLKYQDCRLNQAVPLISTTFVSTFSSTQECKLNT